MKQIYLDLDGVMADFDLFFVETFKKNHLVIDDEEMWNHIFSLPTFFRDLPPCPGALEFFESIRDLDPVILTACPKTDYKNAAINKRNWVREHLGSDVPVLPVLGGKNKSLFMHEAGDILIDDFVSNIKHWNNLGGYGIHHKSFDETNEKLKGYLS